MFHHQFLGITGIGTPYSTVQAPRAKVLEIIALLSLDVLIVLIPSFWCFLDRGIGSERDNIPRIPGAWVMDLA